MESGCRGMTLGQEIMLYFEILPILACLIYMVVKSYIEDKRVVKKEIYQLRKANRMQKELIEREIFLRGNRYGRAY